MSKTYLPYEPDQQLLLPAALQEWLPDDHLAYFISDVVDQLDMSEVTARYERERRGGPPYHPRMMVKVLLYGYCVGVASSRRIAQRQLTYLLVELGYQLLLALALLSMPGPEQLRRTLDQLLLPGMDQRRMSLKPAGKLRDGLISSKSCQGYLGLERPTVLPA